MNTDIKKIRPPTFSSSVSESCYESEEEEEEEELEMSGPPSSPRPIEAQFASILEQPDINSEQVSTLNTVKAKVNLMQSIAIPAPIESEEEFSDSKNIDHSEEMESSSISIEIAQKMRKSTFVVHDNLG